MKRICSLPLGVKNVHSPKKNSEFCFTEKPRGGRVERKQNPLFPEGAVIECFGKPLDSKKEKKAAKTFA